MTPGSRYRALLLAASALVPGLTAGCQQDMADQPSYTPLRASDFFEDKRSARPVVPGTVARGRLRDDDAYFTGHVPAPAAKGAAAGAGATVDAFAKDFPFAMNAAVLKRGQQRFGIYCSMCHGLAGDGDGKIVERGFTKPPSYNTDLSRGYLQRGQRVSLREVPNGYLFDVISNGYGAMAHYREQITPHDRWAIVGYIRVLQQATPPADRVAEGRKP